ncbi:MAG: hypothetical protein OER56_14135 [Hyphomicrobiales bacterium]|nr:hypothetical protein [Hyphomicrobiales bacterium]
MNEPPEEKTAESILEEIIPENSSLSPLQPVQAVDEMITTLVHYLAYCKSNNMKFLAHLFEMVLLECLEFQASQQADTEDD